MRSALATETALLDATERKLGAVGVDAVDEHHAGLDLGRHALGLLGRWVGVTWSGAIGQALMFTPWLSARSAPARD